MSIVTVPLAEYLAEPSKAGSEISVTGKWTPTKTSGMFRKSAEKLGIPLAVVRSEVDGELADYGSDLILVRPDHFICWVDDGSPFEARDILTMSTG